MQSETIVIVYYTLILRSTARVTSSKHLPYLIVVLEQREIPESLHVVRVITKNAVEACVAILQSPHVDRYYSNTRLERLFILDKQTIGACDAADEYIDGTSQIVDIVYDLKFNIPVAAKALNEGFRLVLVTKQLHLEVLFRLSLKGA